MLMNKLLEYLGLDDDGIMASCEQPVGEVTMVHSVQHSTANFCDSGWKSSLSETRLCWENMITFMD